MEHTTYASRLRYLDADDVEDSTVDYDGLDVIGPDGSKLGDVDGFIVDAQAGRVFHVVVDSGGWFSSRRLLLPVGHARLDTGRRALIVDVAKDALSRYPEFDSSRFERFSDEDLRDFESRTIAACCPGEPVEDVSVRSWAYDTRRHYTQPDWWNRDARTGNDEPRLTSATGVSGAAATLPHDTPTPRAESYPREHVTAHGSESSRDDVSPHLEGRAQPGDVLGIETGGETTEIGDTAEDEDKRRRDAERS